MPEGQQYQGPYTINIVMAVTSGQSTMEDFSKAKQVVQGQVVDGNLDQDSDIATSFAEASSILQQ